MGFFDKKTGGDTREAQESVIYPHQGSGGGVLGAILGTVGSLFGPVGTIVGSTIGKAVDTGTAYQAAQKNAAADQWNAANGHNYNVGTISNGSSLSPATIMASIAPKAFGGFGSQPSSGQGFWGGQLGDKDSKPDESDSFGALGSDFWSRWE